jgi:hypothetical protein
LVGTNERLDAALAIVDGLVVLDLADPASAENLATAGDDLIDLAAAQENDPVPPIAADANAQLVDGLTAFGGGLRELVLALQADDLEAPPAAPDFASAGNTIATALDAMERLAAACGVPS